jgi:site-specific recombinase XerD
MGIYQKPDSTFWYMLLEGTGRKRENTGIRCDATAPKIRKANEAAAEAVYHARMTQLARARVGLPIDSKETFQSYSEWYETHHTDKHKAADRERYILANLRAHFGSMRLTEIRPAKWSEYETARQKAGIGINTIGRELAVMKSILKTAVGEHLDVSPLAHVKRKTQQLPAKRTITAADEKDLLEELNDEEIRDLYLVGVGTLLRQMNLITLQRKQLHGTRLVVQTKTGPHAIDLRGPTRLQDRVRTILKRRLPKTPDGFFFPRWRALFAKDRDSGNAFFLKIVRRAVKRAGLQWGLRNHGVVWHTMTRASGATRMIREHGIDIRTVQLIGGWRSLDQMAEYLGVDLSAGTVSEPKSPKRLHVPPRSTTSVQRGTRQRMTKSLSKRAKTS